MTNQIDLVTKYLPLLDEVYKVNAKTAILDADPSMVQATSEANVVKVAKVDMDGLGNYSKTNGYPVGSITAGWETWTFSNDRGRRFNLDKMDNMENLTMAFLGMAGQFLRTKVIPEKDAYTIAAIASHSGVTSKAESLTSSNVKQSIDASISALGEAEVDEGNIVIFCTPTVKGALETQINRSLASGETSYGQKLNYYNEIPLISIPQTRFYNAIDLLDGTSTGETAGGYKKHTSTGASGDADGVNLNYVIMDRNAALTIQKNAVAQIFAPEVNQLHDGWTFNYRFYYDTFVYDNKTPGIIVSKAS